jgi:hypothetical protein
MSIENLASFDNFFKVQYLEKGLIRVLPEVTFLMSKIPFVTPKEKAGSSLLFPVITSYEHGFTAHGQLGQIIGQNPSTVSQNRKAEIKSFPYSGRTAIDVVTMSRAQGDAQTFVNAISHKVENLQKSFALMLEQTLLTGGLGLGLVSSGSEADGTYGGVTFTDGVNVAARRIKIANQTFAEHYWIGSENMPIELYISGAKVLSTTIVTYDEQAEWIEVESLGGLVDLQGAAIFRKGYKDNEGAGLFKIMRQTRASGELFGIDSGNTPMWRVAQYDCGAAPLSFSKVAEGVSRAIGRGLDSKLTLHVHPQTFSAMVPDFATVRDNSPNVKSRIFGDSNSVKKLEHGMVGLTFLVDGIELEVISNPLIWKGEAIGIPEGELRRAGSSDITYQMQGAPEGQYFKKMPDALAVELSIFADLTLAPMSLNKFIRFGNISNGLPSAS